MFLNIPIGRDRFKRFVVRYGARLCAHMLIVCLLGQTLIVLPLPRVRANVTQLPAPISEPPTPFEVSNSGSVLSLLPETSRVIASLFAFAAAKTNEPKEGEAGFVNTKLEPLYETPDRGKLKADGDDPADSGDSPDSLDSLIPYSEFPLPQLPVPPPPAGEIKYDFDGDGKADIGRWRGVATEFKIKNSNGGAYSTYTLGSLGALAAPGDFNGDGTTDAAFFSAGTWKYKTSPSATAQTISWGTAGDIPFAGRFDADSITDAVVFRPSTNTWWIRKSTNGAAVSYTWGAAGDIPITGNWDGDTTTDIAVYRPSNGTWYIRKSSGGQLNLNWGLSYDIPVQGDFDGDGRSDVTVFRPTTGTWYILKSNSGFTAYSAANWGVWSDQPVPANYDDDNRTDLAVWRPTDGNWYILKSTDGSHEIHPLGNAGDTAVPSAYTKQVGGTASGDVINAERVKPRNATGGTNLYSQNFGWGTSLVGLPGRAGLDAGFGIGYNSLIWLKVGNAMYFDPDHGNMTPGFRFGFPAIEPAYYNVTRKKWGYMMVTPSGSRVEFLETAAGSTYETADSSYTQLTVTGATNPFDPAENLSIRVTTKDGTQMTYAWAVSSYKCTQVKDRNGNYITLAYDSLARLSTMTDTLGRVVTVNYGSNGLPSTITQTWKDNNGSGSNATHTWATFGYTTKAVDADFAGSLSIIGPPDGTVFTVLDKITYPDGSSTKFEYNDYLQVKKVSSIAADSASHVLNYVSTNLAAPTSAQTDCPRFTETRSWVENFNQDANGTAQEVVIPNSFIADQQYALPTGGTATGNLIQVTGPDGTLEKTFTAGAGWREGLPIATETWANINSTLTKKRWTWADYTHDGSANALVGTNPRAIETKTGDTENSFVRRATVDYWPSYGLTKEVKVYDTDQTTVLKKSYAEYNLDTAYTMRRIIGLPSVSESYGKNDQTGILEFVSKVAYAYDEENFTLEPNQNISSVIRHDTAYGSSFIIGRANLTSIARHDVTGQTPSVTSRTRYDIAGSVVAKLDPQNRKIAINYTDSFNDNGARNSFAYPTTLTDPANNSSTVKYRFDIGATVRAQSPAPAGNTTGKITERIFDSIGRLQKDLIINTGAYTRYEYPTNGVQSKVFSTIVDTNNNNTADTADEVMSENWADGAGRLRRSRTEHPNSTGGWSGSIVEYDVLGRVKRSSVPTEVSVPNAIDPDTWAPAGDDYTRGWLWTYQKYDWKGRVVRKINTDGVDSPTLNDSDILITYDGCGCAGGEVTTVQSELVRRDDEPTVNARRTQKTYTDILGRAYKTEVFNWDGTSVYTTTVNSFNGRDQVTNTRQYAGSTSANVYQDVVMTFDGHGRMKTRHYPIEDSGTAATWNYNLDDSIFQVIDPRGSITDFTYNSRGLTTQIAYTPFSGGTDAPTVTFAYDNLGNRTSMDTAGVSEVAYAYDSLSRLTSETVDFDDLTTNYTISYAYHLAGELRSITDPFNVDVFYGNDKTGRVTAVTGDAVGTNTTGNYAGNIQYRAFGQTKRIDYMTPDGTSQIKLEYDNRLRVNHSEVTLAGSTTNYLMKADYSYFADSRVATKDDTHDNKFDRTNKYDFAGRLTFNQFGMGDASDPHAPDKRVYEQTITLDAFSNMTTRSGVHWDNGIEFVASYVNGRVQEPNTTFDAAGNIVHRGALQTNPHEFDDTIFDASGRRTLKHTSTKGRWGSLLNMVTEQKNEMVFDGDGRPILDKKGIRSFHVTNPASGSLQTTPWMYQVWSSVLGQSLTTVLPNGSKYESNVYAGGAVIATNSTAGVGWKTADPVTGTVGYVGTSPGTVEEFEPLGQKLHNQDPEPLPDPVPTESVWNKADYPQWMCEEGNASRLYGEFHEWPVECQKRYRQDMWVTTYDFSKRGKKESPQEVPREPTDSPLPSDYSPDKGATYAANSMRSFALTSTAKDDGDDPESKGNKKKRRFSVNVPIGQGLDMSEIPGFVDASQSGDCGKPGQPPCPKKPREAAAKSPCADYLLTQVSVIDGSTNPNDRNKKNIPYVNTAALADFNAALAEVHTNIGTIGFAEMFRDFARQQYLYNNKGNNSNPVARPGTSNHEAGFAFDIPARYRQMKGSNGKTVQQIFLSHNFEKPVSGDPPHFAWKNRQTGAAATALNKKVNAWFLACTSGY